MSFVRNVRFHFCTNCPYTKCRVFGYCTKCPIFLQSDKLSSKQFRLVKFMLRTHVFFFSAEQQQANSAASKMLFVLAGVLLTSNIASAIIAYTLWILVEMKSDLSVQGLIFLEILQYMYPLALFANSTANFPILLITMKKFRETLKIILGMKK